MTKGEAIYSFWSSFGIDAFEEYSVPTGEDSPTAPYVAYSVAFDNFQNEVPLVGRLWYRSPSWKDINEKTAEIAKRVTEDHIFIPCEDGKLWIKRGSVMAQDLSDDNDNMMRGKYINLVGEFLTNY